MLGLLFAGPAQGQVAQPFGCAENSNQVGCWLPPFSENGDFNANPPATEPESARYPTAVSAAVLPNGEVVYWNGIEGSENLNGPLALSIPQPEESRTRRLSISKYLFKAEDPRSTAAWSIPSPESGGGGDLFCADQRQLPDGRVLAVGGTDWETVMELNLGPGLPEGPLELFGRNNARIYDQTSNAWTQAANMNWGRWYPTMLTLPDGRMFVAGGVERLIYNYPGAEIAPGGSPDGTGDNVQNTEVFDPGTGLWTDNGDPGKQSLPLFARLHLLPDGRIFYDGSGQMWGPFGQSLFQATWNFQKVYDPAANTWTDLALAPIGARSGTFSVMLPLKPPYDKGELLLGGGTLGTSPGSLVATNIVEKISLAAADPAAVTRTMLPSLNAMRWYSSGVVLPSGEVMAFSGADKDEVIDPGQENAIRTAEMWNPSNEEWTTVASGNRDRTYHNSAILLPDGSVMVGGHSPILNSYGKDHQTVFANNFKDPSFEIFRPPYLFRGPRPAINDVQKGIAWGGTFSINTSDASLIKSVALVRLPAATHITDADMRVIELPFKSTGPNSLEATAPPNGQVGPPGHYYLYVLSDNGQGLTPSCARIVRLGAESDLTPTSAVCAEASVPVLASVNTNLASTGDSTQLAGLLLLIAAVILLLSQRVYLKPR